MANELEIDQALLYEIVEARAQVYKRGYDDGFAEGAKRVVDAFRTGTFDALAQKEIPEEVRTKARTRHAKKPNVHAGGGARRRRTAYALERLAIDMVTALPRPATIHDFLSHHPDITRATAVNTFQRLITKQAIQVNPDGTYSVNPHSEQAEQANTTQSINSFDQ
jgi:hypothetical protein